MALLGRRAAAKRREVRRHGDELFRVDGEIAAKEEAVRQLTDELKRRSGYRRFERFELLRERGRQAVLRFEIACRRMEAGDLQQSRSQIEAQMMESRQAASALERRQSRHRDWLAKEQLRHDLLRESRIEAETMEGRGHGINQYQ